MLYHSLELRVSSKHCSMLGLEPLDCKAFGIKEVNTKLRKCLDEGEHVFVPSPWGGILGERQYKVLFVDSSWLTFDDLVDRLNCLKIPRDVADKFLVLGIP